MKKIALILRFLLLSILITTLVSCPVTPPEEEKEPEETTFEIRFKNVIGENVYITLGSEVQGGYFYTAISPMPYVPNGYTTDYYTLKSGSYVTYFSYDYELWYYFLEGTSYNYKAGKRYLHTLDTYGYYIYEE